MSKTSLTSALAEARTCYTAVTGRDSSYRFDSWDAERRAWWQGSQSYPCYAAAQRARGICVRQRAAEILGLGLDDQNQIGESADVPEADRLLRSCARAVAAE